MSQQKTPPETFKQGWLQELDGRTGIAQAMRQRYRAFTDDLGGEDRLSYGQLSLVERALWLEYWLGQQERALASNGEFDMGKWAQAVNSLQGILSKLGLHRVAHEVTDLADYLKKKEKT